MVMPKVAEELKPAVAFLERELASWPRVTSKPMFGMLAFYRGKNIFAALPRTRALGAANAIICKLPADKMAGAKKAGAPGKGWKPIEISPETGNADIREALRWLERAYRQAKIRSA